MAAPVTFGFQATVASTDGAQLGAQVGDVINGLLQFESGTNSTSYPQNGLLSLTVGGESLISTQFRIVVENNALRAIDIPGRIADPANTPDADSNGRGDNLGVICQGLGPASCGMVVGNDELGFRPNLVFSGPESQINSTDLSADASFWNAFQDRELGLTFQNLSTGATSYIGAYVGPIQEVPEPAFLTFIVMSGCILIAYFLLTRSGYRMLRR